MEKGGKSGEKHQKIRKKYEIVLKSVFFVVLGDFLGVWGGFWVFFRVFRGFLRKKWFWTAKTAGRPPLRGGGGVVKETRCVVICKKPREITPRPVRSPPTVPHGLHCQPTPTTINMHLSVRIFLRGVTQARCRKGKQS